jgi:hypothetical protein
MDKKARHTANKRRFLAKQRSLGLCLECVNPAAKGSSRCPGCLSRRKLKREESLRIAIEDGKCVRCYKRSPLPGNRMCRDCYLRDVSIRHFGTASLRGTLLDKFEAQDGRCALSGCVLTMGENADLDHIMPVSRGGNRGIENTQWVLAAVNKFKNNMTEEELFPLVVSLYWTMKRRRRGYPT